MCFFTFVTSQFFAKAYIVVGIDKYVKDKVLKKKNFFFFKNFIPNILINFNFSFRLVETNFLSSRNSIVLFRDLLKILKFRSSNFFMKNRRRRTLLVETDFLTYRN